LIYYICILIVFLILQNIKKEDDICSQFFKEKGAIYADISRSKGMNYLGNHLLIELYNCNNNVINNVLKIEELLLKAVDISGATALNSNFHKFSPHGVSGVVVISESHFSIHTWPEYGYCALDIFTCGNEIKSHLALEYLKKELGADNISVTEVKRGILDFPVKLLHKPEVCKK